MSGESFFDQAGGGGADHEVRHRSASAHVEEGEGNWLVSYADMMTLLVGFFLILLSFSKIDANQMEKLKKETTKVFGGEYRKPFENVSREIEEAVKRLDVADQVLIKENELGVEIAFKGGFFFDLGSTEIKEEARRLLDALIPEFKKLASDFYFLVEGHTDDLPTSTAHFPSNWELSSVRACSVLRLFEEAGFQKSHLKAVGYADTRPVLPNRDESGNPIAENQSQNRRVVIKILKAQEG